MERAVKVALCLAVVLVLVFLPLEEAEAGIYCSYDRAIYCNFYECCQVTCVYCEREETGELLSYDCDADFCWGGAV